MLSTADQALAVLLVGDIATITYPSGILAAQVATVAAQYSNDARYPGFGLDLLYVQRDLIKVAIGVVWQQFAFVSGDEQFHPEQKAARLQTRLTAIEAEIATKLEQARASVAGVAVGVMTHKAPISAPLPPPFPDANDPRYTGSPYFLPLKPQTQ